MDRRYKPFGRTELAVPTKNSQDEFDAGVVAELEAFMLKSPEHGALAAFKQLVKLLNQAVARVKNLLANGRDTFDGTLSPARKLDKKKPKIVCHLRNGVTFSVLVNGLIINPFTQRVGVENAPKQQDRFFRGVLMG